VLELTGVSYGPRPAPASAEASKKRKVESVEKVVLKRPKVHGNKGAEPAKTSVLLRKRGLKQSSNTNVASVKSVKLSKKTLPRAITSGAAAYGTLGLFGSKNAPGASVPGAGGGVSGSKAVAGFLVSKATSGAKKAAAPSNKHHIPMVGAMAELSSEESQESSPHGQAVQISALKIVSEPRVQSPGASRPRPDSRALPKIVAPLGVGGGSAGC
jgi:hypothetical protein